MKLEVFSATTDASRVTRISVACSSPCASVSAMNPARSTKATITLPLSQMVSMAGLISW